MLGYGIETTAQVAGVSKNSVLRAEHGEDIRPVTARKIAGGLNVEVADLLGAEYPKGGRRSSLEPSFEDALADERRDAVYQPWVELADNYAERWEDKIATGDFDLGSVNEFVATVEHLLAALGPLNMEEQRELPPQPYSHGVPAARTGRAIHRLLDLFNPLLEAGQAKFNNSELEKLRQGHAEREAEPGPSVRRAS
jgi:transcriptional regulator with XRE-family HTH domain